MEKEDLKQPKFYLNREISLLRFNERVLSLAQNPQYPLLERLNYLLICSMNLDEFFEVRVSNLRRHATIGSFHPGPDSLSSEELLQQISDFSHQLINKQYTILNESLLPELEQQGIHFIPQKQWTDQQTAWAKKYFREHVLPLLSPVALDIAHPLPKLVNKSLNFMVSLSGQDAFGRNCDYAIIHAPRTLPRLNLLPKELRQFDYDYIYLHEIIQVHVKELFPGLQINGCYHFRLTRNADFLLEEETVKDLPNALKSELFQQRFGHAVRLEVAADCPVAMAKYLLEHHDLNERDLYLVDGPVNLSRFHRLLNDIDRPELKFPVFSPTIPHRLEKFKSMFDAIRHHDILLSHPYESFVPVIDLIQQATMDPHVLAIKTILYRTGANSPMVKALVEAARAGKEITAVIELRARFDEADNIELANRLHDAGALVVYGVIGYKTHAKMTLIVRERENELEHFAHLSTGNYHAGKAKLYADLGLLTYDKDLTNDVQSVFQQLTGLCKLIKLKKLLMSPFTLFTFLLSQIEQEAHHAAHGKKSRIIIKINGLTDKNIIRSLYEAAMAGVKIDLIVRGICCLRPGVPGISENITVRSIVGRFLEHARIYYFYNDGQEKIYCASADCMERNLHHRVEACFPILDKKLAERIKQEELLLYLTDNCSSWILQSDGTYQPAPSKKRPPINAQLELLKKSG